MNWPQTFTELLVFFFVCASCTQQSFYLIPLLFLE